MPRSHKQTANLVIGNDLHPLILPHPNTGVGSSQINPNGTIERSHWLKCVNGEEMSNVYFNTCATSCKPIYQSAHVHYIC